MLGVDDRSPRIHRSILWELGTPNTLGGLFDLLAPRLPGRFEFLRWTKVDEFIEPQDVERWHRRRRFSGASGSLSDESRPNAASVLVVEDDEAVRSSVGEILESAGHLAVQVGDGEAARRVLRTLRFDAMVLDLKLPGLDGLSLLAALPQAPPVVTVSAFDLDLVAHRRIGSKIVRHLPKPVHPQHLLDAIAHATTNASSLFRRRNPSTRRDARDGIDTVAG